MISRSGVALLIVILAFGGGSPATGRMSAAGGSVYVVRPDPRLCPSPLCGGYWVARANHARTRCHDGLLRPRCYVTSAVDADRVPLPDRVPEGALAQAVIAPVPYPGLGELGVLVIGDVRAPVGKAAKGAFYRVRDLGIRCVRAPCFSLRATRLNRPWRGVVSTLDLTSIARPSAVELGRAEAALTKPSGLWLLGRVDATSNGGRVLIASRFYLGSQS